VITLPGKREGRGRKKKMLAKGGSLGRRGSARAPTADEGKKKETGKSILHLNAPTCRLRRMTTSDGKSKRRGVTNASTEKR